MLAHVCACVCVCLCVRVCVLVCVCARARACGMYRCMHLLVHVCAYGVGMDILVLYACMCVGGILVLYMYT